jgi:hypothetical protein
MQFHVTLHTAHGSSKLFLWLAALEMMACTQNDKVPDLKIPIVLVSNSSGLKIFSAMDGGAKGESWINRLIASIVVQIK